MHEVETSLCAFISISNVLPNDIGHREVYNSSHLFLYWRNFSTDYYKQLLYNVNETVKRHIKI